MKADYLTKTSGADVEVLFCEKLQLLIRNQQTIKCRRVHAKINISTHTHTFNQISYKTSKINKAKFLDTAHPLKTFTEIHS